MSQCHLCDNRNICSLIQQTTKMCNLEYETLHGVRVYSNWRDTGGICVCHGMVWHQCPNYVKNNIYKRYINKHDVVSKRAISAIQEITPKDVLVEDNNVCSCHNEYWRKCPNIVSQGHTSIKIVSKAEIDLVDATRNDEVAMPDSPRTLAKINADIKKTQNRLTINDRMEDDTKGFYTCWTGIIIGICAATSFVFFPWMCGVAGIVVAIITVWAGITAFTDEKRLMTASQIAELQDKLIDLEAEAEDAQIAMVKEYNQ